MRVYAMRHGEVEYSHDEKGEKLVYGPNAPLAPLGEAQLHKLGEKLKTDGVTFDALYSSPYLRAGQSAAILSDVLAIPHIYEVESLQDVFPSSAVGKILDEVAKTGGDIYSHPLGNEQETLNHLVERARRAIEFIVTDGEAKKYTTVGIVSHGDLLSALDWSLKHPAPPRLYEEMKNAFYLQKAEACEYIIDSDIRLIREGKIISIDEVKLSIEGFRNLQRKK